MTDQFFDLLQGHVEETTAHQEKVEHGLTAAQTYISYGTKVILLTPSIAGTTFAIGRILMPDELENMNVVSKRLSLVPGEHSELPGTLEEEKELHAKGYRRGLFHSQDDAIGWVNKYHLSRLYPITDTLFGEILAVGIEHDKVHLLSGFRQLQDELYTMVESRPGSAYRKACEKCGAKNVGMKEVYTGEMYRPIALKVKEKLTILWGESITDYVGDTVSRHFVCGECDWVSDPINPAEYDEEHACTTGKSVMEALYDVEKDAI